MVSDRTPSRRACADSIKQGKNQSFRASFSSSATTSRCVIVASAFGGLELSIRCYNNAQQVDLVAIARSFGGVGMMALAFVGLFAGVWVSFNKDRLLAWLGDDDTAA